MKALADYCGTAAEDMYFHSIFYVGVNKGYRNDIISANSCHYMRIRLLAMAAIGLNTDLVKLIRTGGKPMLMGACCWVGITAVSLGLQSALGIW